MHGPRRKQTSCWTEEICDLIRQKKMQPIRRQVKIEQQIDREGKQQMFKRDVKIWLEK